MHVHEYFYVIFFYRIKTFYINKLDYALWEFRVSIFFCVFYWHAYFKSNFRRGLRRVLVRFKMKFHVNNFIYKCSTIVLLRLFTVLNVDDKVWFTFIYRFYTCIKWNFPQVSIAFHKTHLLKCDTFMSYTQSNCIYHK